MFKDYIIIDNILNDPEKLISVSKTSLYYSKDGTCLHGMTLGNSVNMPSGAWKGYRTDSIHIIDYDLYLSLMNEIFVKVFGCSNYSYSCNSHLHRTVKSLDCQDSMWHRDDDYILAGVVYLNKDAPKDGGTSLLLNDTRIDIEPVYNRLLLYKADILHRPNSFYGSTMDDSRLTLTMFIDKFSLEYEKGKT